VSPLTVTPGPVVDVEITKVDMCNQRFERREFVWYAINPQVYLGSHERDATSRSHYVQ
jgi:hypothetical protein